jgi:hypothetical protein
MKQGSRTQLEAVTGGLDTACGKADPAGGRGERRQLRTRAPLVSAMKKRESPVAGELNSYTQPVIAQGLAEAASMGLSLVNWAEAPPTCRAKDPPACLRVVYSGRFLT